MFKKAFSVAVINLALAGTFAMADYTYNFDSDATGSLPLNWSYSGGTAAVSTEQAYSGTKSLKFGYGNSMTLQNIGYVSAAGTLTYRVYMPSSNSGSVIAMQDEKGCNRIVVYLLPSQIFSYSDKSGSTYYSGTMSTGVWQKVQIDYNMSTSLFTLYVDDVNKGTHDMYIPNGNKYMVNLSFDDSGPTDYTYYDDVSFTSPYANMTPAKYVVSMEWYQSSDSNYNHNLLGFYDLQSSGNVTCTYWQYNQNSDKTTSDGPTIGGTGTDAAYAVVGLSSFLGSNLATKTGTYTESSGGIVSITWSDSTSECWRRTWQSPTMNKMECFYISKADNPYDCYFNPYNGWCRNASAANGGYAFGGATADFTVGATDYMNADLNGYLTEWNSLLSPSYSTAQMGMGLYSSYTTTPTGVKRYEWLDSSDGLNCFNYVAIPANGSGMYTRRCMEQRSHDFNSNGTIHDDIGHIECSAQVLDTAGIGRGLMYIETTPNPGGSGLNMMGSGFYLDDWSTGLQSGICPSVSTAVPGQASGPIPGDTANDVKLSPTIECRTDASAVSHDIYFGTNQSNVTNATHASAEFKGNQPGTAYSPGALNMLTTYYWRVDEVGPGGTTKGATWSFTTVNKYTEKFQDITIGTANAWTDVDLSGYGVDVNQAVEIGIANKSTSTARQAGVRTKGSSLNRYVVLHAPTTAGWDMTGMTVKADSSKKIQAYTASTSDVHFYLIGVWNHGDYTERFDTLTIGTTGSWTASADLSTYGVSANQVVEVMAAKKSTTAYIAGIRATNSALERKLNLHASTSTAADCLTMLAQSDASRKIQVYKGNTAVSFYLLGYWTTSPGTFTEKFVDVGKPASSATWLSRSLTGQSVPAYGVCEMLMANTSTANHDNVGVRKTGSSLNRLFDLHKSSASTAVECGMMHVEADSSSNIYQYLQNSGDTVNYYLLGCWN
jgi:hypothetical protein